MSRSRLGLGHEGLVSIPGNSCHATLSFGFSMIFLRICNSRVPLDALAARGMRFTSGTHGGCESADPAPADADD